MATLHTEFSTSVIDENKISAFDKKTYFYIKKYGDIPYDPIIAEETDWQIFYNLTELRKGILSWYDFPADAKVLEAGAAFGTLTGCLCRKCAHVTATDRSLYRARAIAARYENMDNLDIYAGEVTDIVFPEAFDCIILIGLLERAGKGSADVRPYADYLAAMRKWLKPGGRLLIAVENRFGLRYFCGEAEPHTRRPFDGINRYPGGTAGYSFSRKEIEEVIRGAGFGYHRFYYPLPDYKLPQLIYTDDWLPGENLREGLIWNTPGTACKSRWTSCATSWSTRRTASSTTTWSPASISSPETIPALFNIAATPSAIPSTTHTVRGDLWKFSTTTAMSARRSESSSPVATPARASTPCASASSTPRHRRRRTGPMPRQSAQKATHGASMPPPAPDGAASTWSASSTSWHRISKYTSTIRRKLSRTTPIGTCSSGAMISAPPCRASCLGGITATSRWPSTASKPRNSDGKSMTAPCASWSCSPTTRTCISPYSTRYRSKWNRPAEPNALCSIFNHRESHPKQGQSHALEARATPQIQLVAPLNGR